MYRGGSATYASYPTLFLDRSQALKVNMVKLDVLKLAEQVNKDSLSGSITRELLLQGNRLYESSKEGFKLNCLHPNGQFTVGYICNGHFVSEEVLVHPFTI